MYCCLTPCHCSLRVFFWHCGTQYLPSASSTSPTAPISILFLRQAWLRSLEHPGSSLEINIRDRASASERWNCPIWAGAGGCKQPATSSPFGNVQRPSAHRIYHLYNYCSKEAVYWGDRREKRIVNDNRKENRSCFLLKWFSPPEKKKPSGF